MKKLVFFIFIILVLYIGFINKTNSQASTSINDDVQVIPDDAIRLRILANSDNEADQAIKHLIRDKVSDQISDWVEHIADINEARALIRSRLPEIEQMIAQVLKEENIQNQNFNIDYDENVTFPAKLYDTFLYPAGEYEAVLITLGAGEGSNWWCVLFPPLCFVDFADGASVAESSSQTSGEDDTEKQEEKPIKKKFFLFEWFGWT